MGSLKKNQNQVELKKRLLFFGTGAAGLVLSLSGSLWIGISLLAAGTYFGWGWFQFRARNGMRF